MAIRYYPVASPHKSTISVHVVKGHQIDCSAQGTVFVSKISRDFFFAVFWGGSLVLLFMNIIV